MFIQNNNIKEMKNKFESCLIKEKEMQSMINTLREEKEKLDK